MECWLDKLKALIYSEKVGRITLDFNVAENIIKVCKYPLPVPDISMVLPLGVDKSRSEH